MILRDNDKNNGKRDRIAYARKRKQTARILWSVFIIAVVALIVWSLISVQKKQDAVLPGRAVADQGREHVDKSHKHTYNSNPPTSGWHYAEAAEWGIYKEELPDETLIHNLEHGGIWISYKPRISEDLRKKLEHFYDVYGRKIIVTPRQKNDQDIALAAWNRLDTFDAQEYSDEHINAFIKAFRNKGPEFVP